MKRLLLLAATVVLASGCVVHSAASRPIYASPAPPPPAAVWYHGQHFVPDELGGGWCYAEGPHQHDYAPDRVDAHDLHEGYYYYRGAYEFSYYGGHPVRPAAGATCGPHTHEHFRPTDRTSRGTAAAAGSTAARGVRTARLRPATGPWSAPRAPRHGPPTTRVRHRPPTQLRRRPPRAGAPRAGPAPGPRALSVAEPPRPQRRRPRPRQPSARPRRHASRPRRSVPCALPVAGPSRPRRRRPRLRQPSARPRRHAPGHAAQAPRPTRRRAALARAVTPEATATFRGP